MPDAAHDPAHADPYVDPYVRALAQLFQRNPVWTDAMKTVAEGAASNVYFSHLPDTVWHLIKRDGRVHLLPGRTPAPDFVFRFTPAAIVALSKADGAADAVAVILFALMLEEDPARRVDFRIIAPFGTLWKHGHVRLLIVSGPKVLAFGARHGVRTLGQLRDLVQRMRRTEPAAWEI